jgi:hypothetical protein
MLHPELADELGRRGQQAIHERYSAEIMAQRTLELYRKVSGERRAESREPEIRL